MKRLYLDGNDSNTVKISKMLNKFAGKVHVCAPGTCPLTMQLALLQMSRSQSCGKCVPCRNGMPQLVQLMSDIVNFRGTMSSFMEMKKLAGTATSREVDRICTPMLSPWSTPAKMAMPMQTSRLSAA